MGSQAARVEGRATGQAGISAFSRHKVARLCCQQRIWSVFSKKRGLNGKAGPPVHDDLVRRQFTADGPDQLWLTDITEHATTAGKLYLCALKDVYSNRIVGYSMDSRMTASLAVWALRNAITLRAPSGTVILHSDRGCQFRSHAYVRTLRDHGLTGSMGRVGACADNAAMESFFALLQKNVLDRQRWATREELRLAIIAWIERTYHRRRPSVASADSRPSNTRQSTRPQPQPDPPTPESTKAGQSLLPLNIVRATVRQGRRCVRIGSMPGRQRLAATLILIAGLAAAGVTAWLSTANRTLSVVIVLVIAAVTATMVPFGDRALAGWRHRGEVVGQRALGVSRGRPPRLSWVSLEFLGVRTARQPGGLARSQPPYVRVESSRVVYRPAR